jgi:hypothetical protein
LILGYEIMRRSAWGGIFELHEVNVCPRAISIGYDDKIKTWPL